MGVSFMGLAARQKQFCEAYRVPKRFHGSLDMMAHMAFILGLELVPRSIPRMRPSDVGLESELIPKAIPIAQESAP